jgi:4-hydroxy-3-methylbut-2-enyl diphosphate reductase
VDVIKGGVLVVTGGFRVFVPASHASVSRMEDLSPLKGQDVQLKIIGVNAHRRHAVGSIRLVAQAARKEQEEAFWAQAEVGQEYTGAVKSLTSYGAFVDLGGVDGMVHISEMSWSRIKHPSEVMNVGDTVTVFIKALDADKRKISLGYRKTEDNPWEIFKAQYPVDSVVTAKVVGMTTFGVFAQIMPGIDGLVHISQIANHRVEKPQDELQVGQEITAKITAIDYDRKRISLSIRALLEPEAPAEAPAEEAAEVEAPVEE